MDALDSHRRPEAVVDMCQRFIGQLRSGTIDPAKLVVRKRVSKPLKAYTQATKNVAALARYRMYGIAKRPGQDVRYVVVDDESSRTPERVRVSFEAVEGYDAEFYATELVRACESIVSPMGWDRNRIRAYFRDSRNGGLVEFG